MLFIFGEVLDGDTFAQKASCLFCSYLLVVAIVVLVWLYLFN